MNAAAGSHAILVRAILRIAIVNGLMLWGLVWAARRTDWPEAWWCIGLLFAGLVASTIYLWRTSPELLAARRRFGAGTKRWDYLMFALVVLGTTGVLHVSGFGVRLGWARFPPWIVPIGNLVSLLGIAGATWAQGVNRHFESSVRVQADRAHVVIDTGPYALVRHPGYVAGVVIIAGMALALGSPFAFIPAGMVVAVLAIRTLLEERLLRTELPGYAEYTRRVRYRWIPGLW